MLLVYYLGLFHSLRLFLGLWLLSCCWFLFGLGLWLLLHGQFLNDLGYDFVLLGLG